MMPMAVPLSGVTSREFIAGILARSADGAGKRVISVGISAALFDLFRHMDRGTNLSLSGNQMTVTAQHPYRVATPGAVERFEQVRKESLALHAQPGLAFGRLAHRWCPACWCGFRAGKMSAVTRKRCEIVHRYRAA